MFSTPPSFHKVLIESMKILGYRSDDAGVCYGFACMAMQAILANDLKTFEDRLDLIYTTKNLKKVIDDIKQKVIAKQALSPEEIKLAEIPAFFDGIELHSRPSEYPVFFTKKSIPTSQNARLTSPLLNSNKMEERGGVDIDETKIFSGIYTVAELTQYFQSLAQVIKDKGPTPFALLLDSNNHTITVSYYLDNTSKQWRILLIDANSYPLQKIVNEAELAKKILAAFYSKSCIAFSTTICAAKKDQQQIDELFKAWRSSVTMKSMHTITTEKAQKVDSWGGTWLRCAAQNGRVDVAIKLLNAGANPEQPADGGITPLFIAAQNGHTKVLRAFLNAGAKPDEPVKSGATPLSIAVWYGHPDCVRELLNYRANINQLTNDGASLLYIAAQNGHTDVVEVLLKAGAKINQARNDGESPLYTAAQNGHTDVLKVLLKAGAKINQARNDGATPLCVAAANGKDDALRELLKAGAMINEVKIKNGATPLHIAAEKGRAEATRELLKAGANINQPKTDGATPLFLAAQKGQEQIVKLLVANKADTDASISASVEIILQLVDEKKAKSAIENFLAAHYPTRTSTIPNFTPLHIAALLGHKEIVQHLMDAGANITTRADGISPLDLAKLMKHQDIVTIIESKLQEKTSAHTPKPF